MHNSTLFMSRSEKETSHLLLRSPGTVEALARGCNWLTYLCLPLWLTPAQFGSFSFVLAMVLLASAIGTAGQDRVILRYVSKDNPQENGARVSVAFLSAIVFSLAVFGCAYVGLSWFDMQAQLPVAFTWVILWGVSQTIYMLWVALSRALNQDKAFFVIRGVYGLTKLLSFVLIAKTTENVEYLIIVEAILLLVVAAYSIIQFWKYWRRPDMTRIWRHSLLFGLPLVLHILAGASLGQLDKLMIANMLEATVLGIYAFINSIAGGVFFIFAVVNIIYEARVYRLGVSVEAENLLKHMFKISMLCAIAILFVANIALPSILALVEKENYYHLESILILSAAYLIYPFYLQANIRFALKEKTKYIPLMTGTAALINIAFNLVLIPKLGITGAAISTLAAYITLVSLAQWTSRKV